MNTVNFTMSSRFGKIQAAVVFAVGFGVGYLTKKLLNYYFSWSDVDEGRSPPDRDQTKSGDFQTSRGNAIKVRADPDGKVSEERTQHRARNVARALRDTRETDQKGKTHPDGKVCKEIALRNQHRARNVARAPRTAGETVQNVKTEPDGKVCEDNNLITTTSPNLPEEQRNPVISGATVNSCSTDPQDCTFQKVTGKEIRTIKQHSSHMVQKEKFPPDFFPQAQWSRKGFLRTRWGISSCDFDLVNIHLFHDAHNVVAWRESPSHYAGIRQKAMNFILQRISDEKHKKLPFFLFGDFNFRMDARPLIEHLCSTGTLELLANAGSDVDRLICRETNNDRKVILEVEKKTFIYADPNVFRANNGTSLLQFDKELEAFKDRLDEMAINFPPTYPYSEDVNHAKEYNNTRCPAWCDRILMSTSAKTLIAKPEDEREVGEQEDYENAVVYDNIGPNVCMGDHKGILAKGR